ncbi:hypothetical protein SGODD07_00882 [Streptococcus gordonii]|uniref:Uncharacterized protein n=2 Tax=Streptococcus gordonii TaxID=1302 RepID=A8AWB1_STRGC|nr:hypothetical protein SGO_0772 [Streptococcus gordonii str. Challis substr. CH1]KXT72013.1 hypothetical protein SGODD07_00882 [Streptococcus gordonii]
MIQFCHNETFFLCLYFGKKWLKKQEFSNKLIKMLESVSKK